MQTNEPGKNQYYGSKYIPIGQDITWDTGTSSTVPFARELVKPNVYALNWVTDPSVNTGTSASADIRTSWQYIWYYRE